LEKLKDFILKSSIITRKYHSLSFEWSQHMISFLYSKGSVVLHDSKFGSVSEGFTLINEKANFSWKALGDE